MERGHKKKVGGGGGKERYTKYTGLKIPFELCIGLSFSWQIAIGNGGPVSALEPFLLLFFFKYWSNLPTVGQNEFFLPKYSRHGPYCLLRPADHKDGPGNRFTPVGVSAKWFSVL